MGTDTDGNVVDALLLGSKRIGHGFSLSRHPYIMERMKKQNICLEFSPAGTTSPSMDGAS
ncbi:hypothetical protein GGTG_14451 [Gaeumannomyces tritici R3-111a-1]|uniref:Uncharacterized protein n=1 Tax=Gaeumannomyces tritici (strain R3-111a-1) TaxID=644352 RepID=J3PLH5_GAET3|nr:hypothetical protein GGTG_14451 [Gaeumannomyces tritici R3-111a-1]EJT67972.1 hypothetical protein GGTG_14451 [Gaeumannomyces tritici R3-111a-1]